MAYTKRLKNGELPKLFEDPSKSRRAQYNFNNNKYGHRLERDDNDIPGRRPNRYSIGYPPGEDNESRDMYGMTRVDFVNQLVNKYLKRAGD